MGLGTGRAFRFGVISTGAPDGPAWRERARRAEALGYSSLLVPDHFQAQWGPLVALAVAAEATERLRVGTLVLANDYRHPLVLAKEIATLDLASGGRVELGLGAGVPARALRPARGPLRRARAPPRALGFSYTIVPSDRMEAFAPVVARLAGR